MASFRRDDSRGESTSSEHRWQHCTTCSPSSVFTRWLPALLCSWTSKVAPAWFAWASVFPVPDWIDSWLIRMGGSSINFRRFTWRTLPAAASGRSRAGHIDAVRIGAFTLLQLNVPMLTAAPPPRSVLASQAGLRQFECSCMQFSFNAVP